MNQIIVLRDLIAEVQAHPTPRTEQLLFELDYRLMHAQVKTHGMLRLAAHISSKDSQLAAVLIDQITTLKTVLLQKSAYAEAYWLLRRFADALTGVPPAWKTTASTCIAHFAAEYQHYYPWSRNTVIRAIGLYAEYILTEFNEEGATSESVALAAERFGIVTNLITPKSKKDHIEIIEDLLFNLPTSTLRELSAKEVDMSLVADLAQFVRNNFEFWHTSDITKKWREDETSRNIIDGVDHSLDHPDNVSARICSMMIELLQLDNVEILD